MTELESLKPEEGVPPAGRQDGGVGVAGVVAGQGDGVASGVTPGVVILHISDNRSLVGWKLSVMLGKFGGMEIKFFSKEIFEIFLSSSSRD